VSDHREGLPDGWTNTSLREIAEIVGGLTKDAKKSSGPGLREVPYLRVANVQRGRLDLTEIKLISASESDIQKLSLQPGDILLNEGGDRDKLGRGWIWQGQIPVCIHQNHVFRARLRSRDIDPFYIAHFTNSVAQSYFAEHGSQTTNLASISLTKLGSLPIRLPPSQEQKRIVAKLEELLSDLDAAVAELKAAQKKLSQYRQSLLKAAVEGALTAEWRAQHTPTETGAQLLERGLTERRARWEAKQLARFKEQGKSPPNDWQKKYREPVQPDTTALRQLPQGWVWASVNQCSLDESAITDGPFGSNLKSSHYQESGPRVIRLQNIGDGVFLDAEAHISEAHYSELLKHSVQEDDVVIAMLGEVLPRACVIPNGVAPAIVKADCARVRVNKDLMRPAVLAAQLNSKPVRDAVLKFIKGIGRPRVNLGHVRAIPIALCSMEEQLECETALSDAQQSIDRQNEAIELSFKQSIAQRHNILRAAFAGQLIPQDPNDEPASVLLERIRAERPERENQPKARRTQQQKEIAAVVRKLMDVLAEAGDWVAAQEVFQRCGVADGAETDQVEALYAELRALDKAGRLAVEAVTDAQGRKLHDRLKLLTD
jgi:type I restriction enzyme, S subunit